MSEPIPNQARIEHVAKTNAALADLQKRKLELIVTILLDANADYGVRNEEARSAWAKRIAREYRVDYKKIVDEHMRQFPD